MVSNYVVECTYSGGQRTDRTLFVAPGQTKGGTKSHGVILSELGKICGADVGVQGNFCGRPVKEVGGEPVCSKFGTHIPKTREPGMYLTSGKGTAVLQGTPHIPDEVVKIFEEEVKELQALELPPSGWLTVAQVLEEVVQAGAGSAKNAAVKEAEDVLGGLLHQLRPAVDEELDTEDSGKAKVLMMTPVGKHQSKETWEETLNLKKLRMEREEDEKQVDAVIESLKEEMMGLNNKVVGNALNLRRVEAVQGFNDDDGPALPIVKMIKAAEVKADGAEAHASAVESKLNKEAEKVKEVTATADWSANTLEALLDPDDGKITLMGKAVKENRSLIRKLEGKSPNQTVVRNTVEERLSQKLGSSSPGGKSVGVGMDRAALESLIVKKIKESPPTAGLSNDGKHDHISLNNGAWTFHGLDGVDQWLEKNGVLQGEEDFAFDSPSMCPDVILLLNKAGADGVVLLEEWEKSEIHHHRTKKSPLESRWATALQSVYPAAFASKSASASAAHGKIGTFAQFDGEDGIQGVSVVTMKALDELAEVEIIRLNEDLDG
jgi:hypothetical protein